MDILNLCLAVVVFLLGMQQAFSTKLSRTGTDIEEKSEQQNHAYNPLENLVLNQNANHNQDTPDSLRRVKRQYGRRYPYPPVWIGGGFGIGPGFGRGFGGQGFGGRGIGGRGGFGGRGGGGHGGGGHGGGGGGHGGGGGRG